MLTYCTSSRVTKCTHFEVQLKVMILKKVRQSLKIAPIGTNRPSNLFHYSVIQFVVHHNPLRQEKKIKRKFDNWRNEIVMCKKQKKLKQHCNRWSPAGEYKYWPTRWWIAMQVISQNEAKKEERRRIKTVKSEMKNEWKQSKKKLMLRIS